MINKTRNIAGFTLVELMIAVILSSFFIAGITQVFTRTSDSFRTQRTLSNMMEDARFALDKLNTEFRRTGFLNNKLIANGDIPTIYHGKIAIDYSAGVYSFRNNGDATPGTLLTMGVGETIRGATNLSGPTSDNVVIRYQLGSGAELANNQYSPCTSGFALVAGELDTDRHIISMVFYMAASATVGSNVLFCRAYRENLDTGGTQLLAAAPLISNVERLRVLYGQTNGSGNTVYSTNTEVTASAAPNWAQVKSARISLALRSEESNISVGTPGNYTLNGKLSIAPTNASEKRLYRVFSTTVAFRNQGL